MAEKHPGSKVKQSFSCKGVTVNHIDAENIFSRLRKNSKRLWQLASSWDLNQLLTLQEFHQQIGQMDILELPLLSLKDILDGSQVPPHTLDHSDKIQHCISILADLLENLDSDSADLHDSILILLSLTSDLNVLACFFLLECNREKFKILLPDQSLPTGGYSVKDSIESELCTIKSQIMDNKFKGEETSPISSIEGWWIDQFLSKFDFHSSELPGNQKKWVAEVLAVNLVVFKQLSLMHLDRARDSIEASVLEIRWEVLSLLLILYKKTSELSIIKLDAAAHAETSEYFHTLLGPYPKMIPLVPFYSPFALKQPLQPLTMQELLALKVRGPLPPRDDAPYLYDQRRRLFHTQTFAAHRALLNMSKETTSTSQPHTSALNTATGVVLKKREASDTMVSTVTITGSQSIQMSGNQEEYEASRLRLLQRISDICDENSVQHLTWEASQDNPQTLSVCGDRILDVKTEIEKVLQTDFPNFNLRLSETDVGCEQLSGKVIQNSHSNIWNQTDNATCEIIMQGRLKSKGDRKYLFAVTSGHLLIKKDETDKLIDGGVQEQMANLKEVRDNINCRMHAQYYTLRCDNKNSEVHLGHPSFVSYRFFSELSTHSHSIKSFFNDIAVLAVEPYCMDSLEQLVASASPESRITAIEELESNEIADIQHLKGKFYIRDMQCKLVEGRRSLDPTEALGHRITFKVISGAPLIPGDSGSVLYYVPLDDETKKMAVAILHGRRRDNQSLYEAVLLGQAFKDIEHDYSHHFSDLKFYAGILKSAPVQRTMPPSSVRRSTSHHRYNPLLDHGQ